MLLLNGMLIYPVAFILLTIAPQYISAPEVSLFALIETVLGPIWVWLGGYEAPPFTAIIGGILLISALSTHR
jgi:drug/metabolite transporter (DMT)-like permease